VRPLNKGLRWLVAVVIVVAAVLAGGLLLLGFMGIDFADYEVVSIYEGGASSDARLIAIEYIEPWSAWQWWRGAAIMFSAWTAVVGLPLLAVWLVDPLARRSRRPWRASTIRAVLTWGIGIALMSLLAASVHLSNWREWWAFAPFKPDAQAVMTQPNINLEAALMCLPVVTVACVFVIVAVRGYMRFEPADPWPGRFD